MPPTGGRGPVCPVCLRMLSHPTGPVEASELSPSSGLLTLGEAQEYRMFSTGLQSWGESEPPSTMER